MDICIKDDYYMKKTWETTTLLRNTQQNIIQNIFPEWIINGKEFLSWFWIELPNEKLAEKIYTISTQANMPIRWGKYGYNKPKYIRVAVREICNFEKLIDLWKQHLFFPEMLNLHIQYKMIKVCDLKSHELIDKSASDKLYSYLDALEYKIIPSIIIDSSTNIIIDGHHRVDVIKRFNIQTINVLAIDYMNPNNGIIVHPNNLTITKEDVIDAGLSGNLLPVKSTKHVIQYNQNQTYLPIISLSKIITL